MWPRTKRSEEEAREFKRRVCRLLDLPKVAENEVIHHEVKAWGNQKEGFLPV